jgi:WD40 repeat protein/serine/threonine protein kinase
MDDLSGSVIRGYELHQRIGYGGFGAVYRAYQPVVQREVAIKVILPERASQPEFIRRFEAEAQIVARLEHLHIVPLYDYWRDPQGAYLVMRYLRGGSLHEALQQQAVWPLSQIVKLLDQITSALAAAHRTGVIHRDLKPANILLDEEGNFFLTDFGIAKDLRISLEVLPEEGFFGSPEYVAPEQVLHEPLSPRADIYSLGILLFELLTGHRPFEASTDTTVMRHHVSKPLPSLLDVRPDLPASLDLVVRRATAKDPDDRYTDVLQLASDFRAVAGVVRNVTTAAATRSEVGITTRPLPATDVMSASPDEVSETLILETLDLSAIDSGVRDLKTSEILTSILPDLRNPYKGLRSFDEADAGDFYGREALVNRLLIHLSSTNFLAVVGPSGSGKSSIVKAGMIPALRRRALLQSDEWFVAAMTPGSRPLENLREALSSVAVRLPENLDEQLVRDVTSLHHALDSVLPGPNHQLVLVVDQFEEMFTLVTDEAARAHFLNLLHTALTIPDSRLRVVLTLRADFYDRPLLYPAFGDLMQQHTQVVLPLSPAELREAIIRPAEHSGLKMPAQLVDAILHDVHEQPGTLPLLQYALTELFERRTVSELTLAAYEDIGGVSGALARRADQIYEQLDSVKRDTARQMFLRLIALAEGADDTRRRVMRVELESLGGQAMREVIAIFGQYRLLIFDRDAFTRAPTVEIAHEALIRQWVRLKQWLAASRAALQTQQRMAQEVSEWLRAGRDPGFLAAGSRLVQFEALAEETVVVLTKDEKSYLQSSLDRRNRAENRRRMVIAVLVVFSLVTLALAALAFDRERQAVAERVRADQEAAIARSRELAVTALTNVEDHLDLALLLSLEAQQAADTFEARSSLLTALEAQPNLISFLHGHTDGVRSTAIDPQGRWLASAGRDRTIILWNFDTRKMIGTPLTGHENWINSLAFSPDGQTLASADEGGVLRLWSAQTGEPIGQPVLNEGGAIWSVAFSPGGQTLVSGDEGGTIRLWDVATGAPIGEPLDGHTDIVFGLDFSGDKLVSASADGTIRLWDAATGAPIGEPLDGHSDWVLAVAFSPDGTTIASGGADNTIRLWDVESHQLLAELNGHTDWVRSLNFLDHSRLVSGSADGTIRLWDVQTGQSTILGRHQDAVWNITVSPDSRWLLSGGADRNVMLWDATGNQGLGHVFARQAEAVSSIAAHGDLLASANGNPSGTGADNTIHLWNIADGSSVATLEGHQLSVTDVAFSPDGRKLASASADQTVRLWNVETGQASLEPLTGHMDAVMSVAFNHDGTVIASGGFDQTIRLWNAQTGAPLNQPLTGHTDAVLSVAFSPDGTILASGGFDGTVRLWNGKTGQALHDPLLGHTDAVIKVVFSPDGTLLASTSRDGTTRVWSLSQQPVTSRVLTGHQNWVLAAAFHPLQPLLATGSRDTTILLWDLTTGQPLGQPVSGHLDWVSTLAFDATGNILYSGSHDRSVRALQMQPSVWRDLACRIANRSLTESEANQYVRGLPSTICTIE